MRTCAIENEGHMKGLWRLSQLLTPHSLLCDPGHVTSHPESQLPPRISTWGGIAVKTGNSRGYTGQKLCSNVVFQHCDSEPGFPAL
jgi:hypothetical protein